MFKPHEHLHVGEKSVTLDGQPLIVEDEAIFVDRLHDDLYVARLGILVSKVTADALVAQTASVAYTKPRTARADNDPEKPNTEAP